MIMRVSSRGQKVILAGRSLEKLRTAKDLLGSDIPIQLDMSDEQQVQAFFERDLKTLDHLVITASESKAGVISELETGKVVQTFESKFLGPYLLAKYGSAKISKQGSITFFFAGATAFKATVGTSAMNAMSAAIIALPRTLALELAPVRINVVSPWIINTLVHHKMGEVAREYFFQSVSEKLPVQKLGQPDDVA